MEEEEEKEEEKEEETREIREIKAEIRGGLEIPATGATWLTEALTSRFSRRRGGESKIIITKTKTISWLRLLPETFPEFLEKITRSSPWQVYQRNWEEMWSLLPLTEFPPTIPLISSPEIETATTGTKMGTR